VTRAHQDGLLELRFDRDPVDRTYLAARRQRFPLRMTTPLYLDPHDRGMAFVYAQNPTGGVFAGDRLVTRVAAGSATRVHLTTQSATKLYRMDGAEAVQDLRFSLAGDAYLEHVPDLVIPQAGARFRQRTLVDMEPEARFVAAETLAPGRRARGERFAYDLVELRSEVSCGGRRLCADAFRLEPRRRTPAAPGILGDHDYLASLLVVAPGHDADALARELDDAVAGAAGARAAAGVLPAGAGALVRVLAATGAAARAALHRAWEAARLRLLGIPLPPLRK
jgi:urease accessory protein